MKSLVVSLIAVFMLSTPVCGIGVPLPSQQETEEDKAYLDEVIRDGYRGDYRNAILDLEEYIDSFPDSMKALEGLAAVLRSSGRYGDALEFVKRWRTLDPKSVKAACMMAELQMLSGDSEKAFDSLAEAEAIENTLAVRTLKALFSSEIGKRSEAQKIAEETIDRFNGTRLDGEGLCCMSRLFLLLNDYDQAARAAVYADERFNGRKGPNYKYERYDALLILGDLYRRTRLGLGTKDKGSGNRALDCYRDALKVNPNLPEALLGIARTRFYALNIEQAHEALDKALSFNKRYGDALALKAHLLTLTRQYEKATREIEKGLGFNPQHKALWAQKAAVALLEGNFDEFDNALAQALRIDPHYGEAHFTLADLLIYHYRFSEAEEHLKKCLELDPSYSEAYIMLGRTLANLGREEEARQTLIESIEKDPFDYPWRNNMLRILSDLDSYIEVNTDQFQLMLDVAEAEVMKYYLLKWGQESTQYFTEKYAFDADGPILMEMFPNSQDFAVRTIGFTGLGALGACFGQVVTLLSPRAGGYRGNFCWACTLHHELCHVFTMQMSKHRIPRWLTEGASVYEEAQKKKAWRRNMDMELFNAYHNDRLFKIERFDQDFLGPRILFAYYQAGLTVEFIVDHFGWDSFRDMIIACSRDLDAKELVEEVLEVEIGQFEIEFRNWIWDQKLAHVRCRPFYDDDKRRALVRQAKSDPQNLDLQWKAAWASLRNGKRIDALYFINKAIEKDPGSGEAELLLGELAYNEGKVQKAKQHYEKALELGIEDLFAYRNLGLFARDRGDLDEAIRYLKEAKACFPSFVDASSPSLLLIQVYLENDQEEKAMEEMAYTVEQGLHEIQSVITLAEYYSKSEDLEKALNYFEEAIRIDPFQRDVHVEYAKVLRKMAMPGQALEELDLALRVAPELEPMQMLPTGIVAKRAVNQNQSQAEIHAEKGEIFFELDEMEKASKEVERALFLKPDHSQALALKKKLDAQSSTDP